jgi:hypothetical protein
MLSVHTSLAEIYILAVEKNHARGSNTSIAESVLLNVGCPSAARGGKGVIKVWE